MERFNQFVEKLRHRLNHRGCAILFGSRAQRESHFFSDFDVLIIVENQIDEKTLRLWARDYYVDLFVISSSVVEDEIQSLNTVVLDAFFYGTILFDDLNVFGKLKKLVDKVLRTRQLVKHKIGWTVQKTKG